MRATLIMAAIMLCALLMLTAGPAVSTENSETASHTIKMPSGETLTVLPIDPSCTDPEPSGQNWVES